jgi:hypothetical protein
VLIAGGGIAAIEALLTLCDLAPERVRIELLAPEPQFVHRPLFVAEPFGIAAARTFTPQLASSGSDRRSLSTAVPVRQMGFPGEKHLITPPHRPLERRCSTPTPGSGEGAPDQLCLTTA